MAGQRSLYLLPVPWCNILPLFPAPARVISLFRTMIGSPTLPESVHICVPTSGGNKIDNQVFIAIETPTDWNLINQLDGRNLLRADVCVPAMLPTPLLHSYLTAYLQFYVIRNPLCTVWIVYTPDGYCKQKSGYLVEIIVCAVQIERSNSDEYFQSLREGDSAGLLKSRG